MISSHQSPGEGGAQINESFHCVVSQSVQWCSTLVYCKTSHSVAVFLNVANRNQKLIAAPSRTCLFLKSEINHLLQRSWLEFEFLPVDESDYLQDETLEESE